MAAGITPTQAIVNQEIVNVAKDQRKKYYRLKQYYDLYIFLYPDTTHLTATGLSAGDATLALNFILDLGRLATRMSGGAGTQVNYLTDVNAVVAWQGDPLKLKSTLGGVAYDVVQMYYWWLDKYDLWNTTCNNAALLAAPLSYLQPDATLIDNVVADLHTLVLEFVNGAIGATSNMLANCDAVTFVQG